MLLTCLKELEKTGGNVSRHNAADNHKKAIFVNVSDRYKIVRN